MIKNIYKKYTQFFSGMTAAGIFTLTLLMPIAAHAQVLPSSNGTGNFSAIVTIVVGMVKSLIPLVIALALLYFTWGLFQLVRSNSESDRKDAVTMITFGIIALFVMVAVWGLVGILTSTFFAGGITTPFLK